MIIGYKFWFVGQINMEKKVKIRIIWKYYIINYIKKTYKIQTIIFSNRKEIVIIGLID